MVMLIHKNLVFKIIIGLLTRHCLIIKFIKSFIFKTCIVTKFWFVIILVNTTDVSTCHFISLPGDQRVFGICHFYDASYKHLNYLFIKLIYKVGIIVFALCFVGAPLTQFVSGYCLYQSMMKKVVHFKIDELGNNIFSWKIG